MLPVRTLPFYLWQVTKVQEGESGNALGNGNGFNFLPPGQQLYIELLFVIEGAKPWRAEYNSDKAAMQSLYMMMLVD